MVQIPSDAVKYVVQEGETLYGICIERYHSMAQIPQICAWNGLADENHISVGQELYLPANDVYLNIYPSLREVTERLGDKRDE